MQFGDETGPPPAVLQIGDRYQVQGTRRAKAGRGECAVRIPDPSARAGSKIERWREIFLERSDGELGMSKQLRISTQPTWKVYPGSSVQGDFFSSEMYAEEYL